MARRTAENPDGLVLFDSHCHLTDSQFASDIAAVIKRARRAGVKEMLTASVNVPDSIEAVALCRRFEGVYCAVGIHAHEADRFRSMDIQALKDLCIEPQVKAIGETGLDYFRSFSSKANQETAFRAQIELAKMMNLPLVIHIRDAGYRVKAILEEYGHFSGVLHCFSGDRKLAEWAVERGFYISFSGSLTYGEQRLADVAKAVPCDRLMIETDAPSLVPASERGKMTRNEPALVRLTLVHLAGLVGLTPVQLAAQTRENARRCFRIGEK